MVISDKSLTNDWMRQRKVLQEELVKRYKQIAELQEGILRLKCSLEKYGWHFERCDCHSNPTIVNKNCSCGFGEELDFSHTLINGR